MEGIETDDNKVFDSEISKVNNTIFDDTKIREIESLTADFDETHNKLIRLSKNSPKYLATFKELEKTRNKLYKVVVGILSP